VAGLELYRANMPGSARPSRCSVPTLVLAPAADRYVTVPLATESPAPWTDDLRTNIVDGGHWTMVRHPERITAPLTAFVEEIAAR
jgi:pimeloyl-ACP methyl ester carboxylesterase